MQWGPVQVIQVSPLARKKAPDPYIYIGLRGFGLSIECRRLIVNPPPMATVLAGIISDDQVPARHSAVSLIAGIGYVFYEITRAIGPLPGSWPCLPVPRLAGPVKANFAVAPAEGG